jgi:ferredoxin-NADP reductase
LFYADEIERRVSWMPRLTVRIGLSRPQTTTWIGPVANPVQLIEPGDLDDDVRAYVGGPPAMVEAAFERLTAWGLPALSITTEAFNPSQPTPEKDSS